MAGKKGCSGRKKDPTKEVQRMLDKISVKKLPNILWNMACEAEGKTVEGKYVKGSMNGNYAFYLADRIMGRPHQSIDNRVKGSVDINFGALKTEITNFLQQNHITNIEEFNQIEEIKQIGEENGD